MRDEARIIRETINMTDIMTKYGMKYNKARFINCPFHKEKTASLKIYKGDKGWHCFGCGQGGSVIDFVMLYFDTDFRSAIKIINNDFNLRLFDKPTLTEQRRRDKQEQKRRQEAEQKRRLKEEKEAKYWNLFDEWKRLDENKRKFAPKSPDEGYNDNFVESVHKLPYIEYLLEIADNERVVI